MPDLADELRQVPLFADLGRRELQRLARGFKEQSFEPGRTVVREGHMDGIGFFVVVDGTATVSVCGETIDTLGPGSHFGELAMICERERNATVTAETPLECLMMAFWDFRDFAHANPDVTWKLLQHVAGLLEEERSRRPPAQLDGSSTYSSST